MANSISITGGKVAEQQLAIECIDWCIKELLPKYRTLAINVRLKDMEDHGCCYNLADHGRAFKLALKKGLGIYELISTICHEMVHVKQYAKKELRWCNRKNNNMWKTSIKNDVAYEEQPWEKEAYKLEQKLAIKFFTTCASTL